MDTKGTAAKIKWLQSIGFTVVSLEECDGWIATDRKSNMTIMLTDFVLSVNDGLYTTTNWRGMHLASFSWHIRSYMLEVNGVMSFNDEELEEAQKILSHHHAFDMIGGLS